MLSELAVIDQGLSVLQNKLRSLNTQTEEIAIEQIKQQQQLKNIGQQFQQVEDTLIEKRISCIKFIVEDWRASFLGPKVPLTCGDVRPTFKC